MGAGGCGGSPAVGNFSPDIGGGLIPLEGDDGPETPA